MDVSAIYQSQRDVLVGLITGSGVTGDEPVRACPGWTVRDVASHVVGLADDWLTGDLEVYASAEWTAKQVDATRGHPLEALCDLLRERGDRFAAMLGDLSSEPHLPDVIQTTVGPSPVELFPVGVLIDLTQHVYDVASALSTPVEDSDGVVGQLNRRMLATVGRVWKMKNHEPVTVRSSLGDEIGVLGRGDTLQSLTVGDLDLFRSFGGRRTIGQIRGLDWGPGPPADEVLRDVVVPFFALPSEPVE